ncbi:MAG: hypothetical protein ACRCUS_03345 [Anaerovoracaceae bacterium]
MENQINKKTLEILSTSDGTAEQTVKALKMIFEYCNAVLTFRYANNLAKLEDLENRNDSLRRIDRERTDRHNDAIMGIRILNKMAENAELEPFYTGDTSSTSQPWRGEMARALFQFYVSVLKDDSSYGDALKKLT